jgi:hypothetical protein
MEGSEGLLSQCIVLQSCHTIYNHLMKEADLEM